MSSERSYLATYSTDPLADSFCLQFYPRWLQGRGGHQMEAAHTLQFRFLLSGKVNSLGHPRFLARDTLRVA